MKGSEGPVLIIGNSDGIGFATTELLLSEGRTVLGLSRSSSMIDHQNYRHVICDVTSERYLATLEELGTTEPDLDTVIHCAGVGSGFDPTDLSGEQICFRTNLVSVVDLAAVFIPRWVEKGRGHLVVLSSIADGFVVPDAPSYAASKAGLSRYLRGLGLALKKQGVYVSNLRFGFVDTKMAQADVKPFEITREKAAQIVVRSLMRKPTVWTRPRRAGALAAVLSIVQRVLLRIQAALGFDRPSAR